MAKPESIENRWDILYRDYPEVYDEFAGYPYEPRITESAHHLFNFTERTMIDVGSGSGSSTLDLARYARSVLGIEPEAGMRAIAEAKAAELGARNVRFAEGRMEAIPLGDASVDAVASFFATMHPPAEAVPRFIAEALRVARPGGLVLSVDIAPGWYGGELHEVIGEDLSSDDEARHRAFTRGGFSYTDFECVQRYPNLDRIVATYGFIFGRKAIAHLRERNQTTIRWRYRAYHLTKPA